MKIADGAVGSQGRGIRAKGGVGPDNLVNFARDQTKMSAWAAFK